MEQNPLASTPRAKASEHPAMAHARAWHAVQQMTPQEMPGHADRISYVLPILGALAANPDVTRKDVIKAAADASGSGKVSPSIAVGFITQMPSDPEKLRPWLKDLYTQNLSAMVHLKAAQMAAQQPQPAVAAAPPAAPVS